MTDIIQEENVGGDRQSVDDVNSYVHTNKTEQKKLHFLTGQRNATSNMISIL